MEREVAQTAGPQVIDTSGRGKIRRLSVLLAYRFMKGDPSKAKEIERFLKFCVVGTAGAVVDFGTGAILLALLKPVSGSPLIAVIATISFVAAIINNFIWNRYWTYPDSRSKSALRQLGMFSVVSVTGWIIRTIILMFLQPFLAGVLAGFVADATEESLVAMSYFPALAVAVGIVLVWNFFINRFWTYNDVEGSFSRGADQRD